MWLNWAGMALEPHPAPIPGTPADSGIVDSGREREESVLLLRMEENSGGILTCFEDLNKGLWLLLSCYSGLKCGCIYGTVSILDISLGKIYICHAV